MTAAGQGRDCFRLFEVDRIEIQKSPWRAGYRENPGTAAFDPKGTVAATPDFASCRGDAHPGWGASILIADLDDEQKTTAIWAANRKRNGLQPDIRVEVASARKAYDLVGQTDVLVIDAPGWADAQTLFVAKWATFTVVPTRANRSDDLAATSRFQQQRIRCAAAVAVFHGVCCSIYLHP